MLYRVRFMPATFVHPTGYWEVSRRRRWVPWWSVVGNHMTLAGAAHQTNDPEFHTLKGRQSEAQALLDASLKMLATARRQAQLRDMAGHEKHQRERQEKEAQRQRQHP